MNNNNILEYLYYYKIKNYQTINSTFEKKNNYQITNECSNITECYQITNKCCKNINKFRQYQTTIDETIVVGLELPNQQGKLIRLLPRNITIITKQG
jgi:hypothetical protein